MMGLGDRILLAVFTFIMALVSLAALLAALGWELPFLWLGTSLASPGGRVAVALTSFVLFAVSVRFLYFGFKRRSHVQTLVHDTALGQVRITLAAVENLVRRVTRQVKGVRDVRAAVTGQPEGLAVSVRTVVSPDVNIPETSEEIQRTIRRYTKDVVGVEVSDVKVFVENISAEGRRGRRD